ncbi:alpha-crystallin A chain-like [Daktulosphaira vitifoliae]|uniref:alpha-crystallin A chain-like n=1 Tax=Daktulosphaira vitifoliae TaxID=58002 RepID=UPI0021AACD74|nr:alpha-crystallin A chain-like [Daktulosphaira vitifoliae]
MSLLPYLLEEFSRPTVYDQHFGLGLFDDDIIVPRHALYRVVPSMTSRYQNPWRLVAAPDSGLSRIQNDKNGFKVNLDVQQFKPDEVNVKVVDDYVVIDGKHEERSDEHGFISRQFTRRYKIPENVDPNAITSTLSSDGVLSIGAPKKTVQNNKEERSIPIVNTNQPSIKVSDKKEKEGTEKMES